MTVLQDLPRAPGRVGPRGTKRVANLATIPSPGANKKLEKPVILVQLQITVQRAIVIS
jgi:hypothetical protein